jgi:hypothetical protein
MLRDSDENNELHCLEVSVIKDQSIWNETRVQSKHAFCGTIQKHCWFFIFFFAGNKVECDLKVSGRTEIRRIGEMVTAGKCEDDAKHRPAVFTIS